MRIRLRRMVPALVALGVLALLASGGPPLRAPVAQGAAKVIATVGSGGKLPYLVAVNPGANLVYVTHTGSGGYLSIRSGQPPFAAVTPPISVGASATGVAYDPLGSAVFVADSVHHVMPYQALPPFAVLGPPITTGAFPVWVAVNPKINRIYVANFASENVEVYDRAAPGFPFVVESPYVV